VQKRTRVKHDPPVYTAFVNHLVPESSAQCTLQRTGI